jgi:hypothetical protein
VDNQRAQLGAARVGTPANELQQAIARLASMEEYQQIRFDAVEFYCQRLLFRELISLIDESLTLEQLAELDPDTVKVVFLMLLRDMMQSHRQKIVKTPQGQKWDTQWIEQFILGLFYELQAPVQPYQDWLSFVADEDTEDSAPLMAGLAGQLGVNPKMLYIYQLSACDVVLEEVLS